VRIVTRREVDLNYMELCEGIGLSVFVATHSVLVRTLGPGDSGTPRGSATKSVDPFASHVVTRGSDDGTVDRNRRPVSVDWVPSGWSGCGVPGLIMRKYVNAGSCNIPTDSTEASR